MPFKIDENEIITAAYVTAQFLNKELTRGCSVLVIGLEGIRLELENVGFKVSRNYCEGEYYGAVVVGLDKNFAYHDITESIKVFQNHPEALMIGCNMDATYVGEGGQIFPGTGSLVQAVSHATGKNPIIMGKPNNYIYSVLKASCPQFDPNLAVFIGDRLDSDIEFANNNGIFSILVETGVHKSADIKEIKPSLIIKTLQELNK